MAGKKHNSDSDIMLELSRATQFQDYPILVQYGIQKSTEATVVRNVKLDWFIEFYTTIAQCLNWALSMCVRKSNLYMTMVLVFAIF